MTNKLTVVLWKDRHSDPTVHLFTDRARAEEWARRQGHEFDRHNAYREDNSGDDLVIHYSVESDCLTVFELEVDADA